MGPRPLRTRGAPGCVPPPTLQPSSFRKLAAQLVPSDNRATKGVFSGETMSEGIGTTPSTKWSVQRRIVLAVSLAAVCGILFYVTRQPQVQGPLQFLSFAWAFAMSAALEGLLRPPTTTSLGGLALMFLLTSLVFIYLAIDGLG